MLSFIETINGYVNDFVWGVPAMICILGVGLVLSFRTHFIQLRKFGYALKNTIGRALHKTKAADGATTPFNRVHRFGCYQARVILPASPAPSPSAVPERSSGCGSLHCFGMCTKFSEVTLAVHFREKNKDGDWVGGPMYYIKTAFLRNGTGWQPFSLSLVS